MAHHCPGVVPRPSLETQAEDEDVKWKEDEDTDDGEGSDNVNANSREQSVLQLVISAVRIRWGRRGTRGVAGGKGVD